MVNSESESRAIRDLRALGVRVDLFDSGQVRSVRVLLPYERPITQEEHLAIFYRQLPATDSATDLLADVESVRELDYCGCATFSNRHVDALNLPSRRNLHAFLANATAITDVALSWIGKTPRLSFLLLSRTSITNRGLADLSGLQELRELDLSHTDIDENGLLRMQLSRNTHLRYLNLEGTKTGSGINKLLRDLPMLEILVLSNTQIQSDALTDIHRLERLNYLAIQETSVSDEAIPSIRQLQHLEYFYTVGTKISGAAIDQLRRDFPHLRVIAKQ